MKRTLNATGRQRVRWADVTADLRKVEDPFDRQLVDISLAPELLARVADWDPPADITYEIYRGSFAVRLSGGTTASPTPVTAVEVPESSLIPEHPLLRVMLTDPASGRIRALGDQIPLSRPDSPQSREWLLPVESTLDGEDAWRVDTEGAIPVLHLNRRLDREALVQSPMFRALVLPEAVRQVVVAWYPSHEGDSEDSEKGRAWSRFISSLVGRPRPAGLDGDPDNDFVVWEEFALDVSSAWARRLDAVTAMLNATEDD